MKKLNTDRNASVAASVDRHFCTLFDSNYLFKGVTMINSLLRHCSSGTVHVLCMDESTFDLLSRLKITGVRLIRLGDVEEEDLLRVKPGRSVAEYCWTLGPALCWHIFESRPEVEIVTYLDADLMFFSNVEPLFEEIGASSIAVIEHRFTSRLAHLEAYGRFNVEWVSFRRNDPGLSCLSTWRRQCIEWCFNRLEDNRLGDQKYLDNWPTEYSEDLHILKNKGAGIAPWNFPDYKYRELGDQILVDDTALIFYHFQGFQMLAGEGYDYMARIMSDGGPVPHLIYERYITALQDTVVTVRDLENGFSAGIRSYSSVFIRRLIQKSVPVEVKNLLRRIGVQVW